MIATPGYLERRGVPQTPEDLADHAAIVLASDGGPRRWTFQGPDGLIVIMPTGPLTTNDAEHVRVGVLSGLGLAQAPTWLFSEELASGAAVRLLKDYPPLIHAIHAVTPAGRLQSARVKLFTEFLAQRFAGDRN